MSLFFFQNSGALKVLLSWKVRAVSLVMIPNKQQIQKDQSTQRFDQPVMLQFAINPEDNPNEELESSNRSIQAQQSQKTEREDSKPQTPSKERRTHDGRLVKTVNNLKREVETGEFIMENTEMAEKLNNYFVPVSTDEDTENLPETLGNQGTCENEELKEININKEVILKKLTRLKVDKFPGPDELLPRVLKQVAVEIMDALVLSFKIL
ncbi:uncharacterized protein [Heterodontus francisci]|uniref:uncharacterized protein n=1 Tax=Heterodontus francisci TaxID=7792 RepID=UPI00355B53B5